jgi:uncharacterized cupin superfamily protein
MSTDFAVDVTKGDGYAVSSLDRLGEGWGFRKIRGPLGLTAFGANAIVMPPGYSAVKHAHEKQEELYFVHAGTLEIAFGDGTAHRLGSGGLAWVDASTVRGLSNVGDDDVVYLCVGGKDGYVERDGVMVD